MTLGNNLAERVIQTGAGGLHPFLVFSAAVCTMIQGRRYACINYLAGFWMSAVFGLVKLSTTIAPPRGFTDVLLGGCRRRFVGGWGLEPACCLPGAPAANSCSWRGGGGSMLLLTYGNLALGPAGAARWALAHHMPEMAPLQSPGLGAQC